MILVVGAAASGKRTYARSLGFPDSGIVVDAQELARGAGDVAAIADELAGNPVVLCTEVGSGVVPLDAGERAWRERAGRLAIELASRADAVVRMVCGIPVMLKGRDGELGVGKGLGLQVGKGPGPFPTLQNGCQPGFSYRKVGNRPGPFPTREPGPFPTVELVLVRHGQTPGNAERRYVGCADDQPLSAEGRAQAQAAGPFPGVCRVYVSPLRRARETAFIMFPDAAQVVVEGVQEMDFGAFTGRSADEMEDDPAYRSWVEGGCAGRCPGGESRAEFADRVCRALERLLREAAARGEDRVVLVAHGGTMMASLSRFADDARPYHDWLLGNCEAYRIRADLTGAAPRFTVLEEIRGGNEPLSSLSGAPFPLSS